MSEGFVSGFCGVCGSAASEPPFSRLALARASTGPLTCPFCCSFSTAAAWSAAAAALLGDLAGVLASDLREPLESERHLAIG